VSVGWSELAGHGKAVEDLADRPDAHEQPDCVLKVAGAGEISDSHRVIPGVADEVLSDLAGALVSDVPVARTHPLLAHRAEQPPKFMLKLLATGARVKDFTSWAYDGKSP